MKNKKRHRLKKSFKYAFQGISYNFKTQPNFRIHTLCAILAAIGAIILQFSAIEWAILSIIILMVFVAEAFNTAIEEAVNCATKELNENAKVAKDSAAAAVLLLSLLAVIVGSILYIKNFISLIGV